MRNAIAAAFVAALLVQGCSRMALVPYESVERTHWVEVELDSGKKMAGSVVRADPVQLALLTGEGKTVPVPRDRVRSVRRKPPVTDDFGKGISEEEIRAAQKPRNARIFGFGGGAMSLGFSFFGGSLAAQSSRDGGRVLAAATLAGTSAGTWLFIKAGRSKDRREAIEAVRARRRAGSGPAAADPGPDLVKRLEEERKKQENMRREREILLRELEKKQNPESGP